MVSTQHAHQDALDFLSSLSDPALYVQMTQTLLRGMGDAQGLSKDGVLVVNRPAQQYMIAARTPQEAMALCGLIPDDARDVLVHGGSREAAEQVRSRFGRANVLEFSLYAYYGECPEAPQIPLRTLEEADLDFLCAHYGYSEREYLEQRVRSGVMLGAQIDGRLAGFVGEHIEGALGLLHILPEYRRMGLGAALERAAMRRTMLAGGVPYVQVFPDNQASHRLQRKLGFTPAKDTLYWICDEAF